MRIKVLKIQKSNKSIWETKLSVHGTIDDTTQSTEQAYEMMLHVYDGENSMLPTKSIVVSEQHHANNIRKYGMDALLLGVNLVSALSVTEEHGSNHYDKFEKEIESIAYSIVARMEQDTFFNHYNPAKMREYIEDKLMSLKDKFKIERK